MTDQHTVRSHKLSRWMRIILVISLTLNLLIIGAVGGAILTGGKWKSKGGHRGMFGGPLTRALSPEDRRAIGRAMRDAHHATRPTSADHEALIGEITAVPFDAQAVEDRLTRHRGAMVEQFELGQRLLIERLVAMTDSERAAFAERLSEHRSHRRH